MEKQYTDRKYMQGEQERHSGLNSGRRRKIERNTKIKDTAH
jgi:hypothetical protein